MNADERISVLTMFQTLKAKTSRLLDPVVQSEGLTLLALGAYWRRRS